MNLPIPYLDASGKKIVFGPVSLAAKQEIVMVFQIPELRRAWASHRLRIAGEVNLMSFQINNVEQLATAPVPGEVFSHIGSELMVDVAHASQRIQLQFKARALTTLAAELEGKFIDERDLIQLRKIPR